MTRQEMIELKELLREAARVLRKVPDEVRFKLDFDPSLPNALVMAACVVSAGEKAVVDVKNEAGQVIGHYMLVKEQ